jgi:hypothetical protein
MKKAPPKKSHLKKRFNLEDFSDPENVECVSEDGLWALALHVSTVTQMGWSFIDLYRDEKKPGIVHLLYEAQGKNE